MMGAQYAIFNNLAPQAEWFKLGVYTASAADYRSLHLQPVQHSTSGDTAGVFKAATLTLSTTDLFGTVAYDDPSQLLGAHAELQTTTPSWGTIGQDFVVQRVSETVYAIYFLNYPNHGTGFFSVQHPPGDAFSYSGTYHGTSLPPNGAHPMVLPLATPESIGAAPTDAATFTGTLACQDLTVSGTSTFNGQVDVLGTATTGNRIVTIDAPASNGTSFLYMKAKGATGLTGNLFNDGTVFGLAIDTPGRNMVCRVTNATSVTLTPLQIYANGAVSVGNSISTYNKMLVLYDFAPTQAVNSTNFYGFGMGANSLRYQAATAAGTHRFFFGDTLGFTVTNTGGSPASDARFKTELQPIEGALEKISQLQGKTFKMYDNKAREMGFVAQEVLPVVPEVVYIDESDENRWHSLKYDKLTALLCEGIKELLAKVTALEARVAALDANPA